MKHARFSHTHTRGTVAACLLLLAGVAAAQDSGSPYAGEQARAIKSLSEREVTGLLEGQGAGLAKAAELNGYPGPAHTLELKEPLGLSPGQASATAAMMATHKARARELGAAVVAAERRLDALFAERRADSAAVAQATHEVALLHARLRAEHLETHLKQTALLDDAQIMRYAQLRGYTAAHTADPVAHRPAAPAAHPGHH